MNLCKVIWKSRYSWSENALWLNQIQYSLKSQWCAEISPVSPVWLQGFSYALLNFWVSDDVQHTFEGFKLVWCWGRLCFGIFAGHFFPDMHLSINSTETHMSTASFFCFFLQTVGLLLWIGFSPTLPLTARCLSNIDLKEFIHLHTIYELLLC